MAVVAHRRAKPVMARLGVPLVDAGNIVEGQRWATRCRDGRHYHPMVPMELITLLEVLTSPPPPPLQQEEGPEGHLPLEDEEYDSHGSPRPRIQNFGFHDNV